eukprot:13029328-Alexandrium_andersonii.AAC.1
MVNFAGGRSRATNNPTGVARTESSCHGVRGPAVFARAPMRQAACLSPRSCVGGPSNAAVAGRDGSTVPSRRSPQTAHSRPWSRSF